ncbi:hypothetical protein G7Y79_00126g102010 [Physcia stellaris]|nr:hypothetical protein G7Y79_00126g102010 [Physcia stellaris]
MHCPEAQKRADPEVAKAEILKAKQRLQELRQRRAQREAIEAARPIPTPRDIGIFDPTLICDIQEFGLYSQVTGFLQHLERQQSQHQYRKSDVLALLPKCLRGPAFAWFKDQTFTTIQDFGRGLACAFPTTSIEPTAKTPAPPVSQPPTHYHSCVECSAQFSSMSRLLEHTRQETACCNTKAICKHCEQGFNSKNKLHDHIREYHAQKPVTPPATSKNSNLRSPAPESTYKIKEKPAVICLPASLAPPTPPATPKSISYPASISEPVSSKGSHLPIATLNITPKQAEIAAMLATRGFTPKRAELAAFNCPLAPPPTPPASISPKCSDLPIATLNITPKSMEKLPANSLTPPTSPPRTPPRTPHRTPVPEHQKPYLTIDDLIHMFRGKPRPFGLRQHQKRRPSPQSIGARPPATYQSRITTYFLPAANQKAPISQGLKSFESKSFQQPTPAETIRPALLRNRPFHHTKKASPTPRCSQGPHFCSQGPHPMAFLRFAYVSAYLRHPFDLGPQITFVAPASVIPAFAMARSAKTP